MNAVVMPAPEDLAQMVSSVTETMCGLRFAVAAENAEIPSCWRMAVLPIHGETPIEIALYSDKAGCEALSASLFSMPVEELDQGMLDDSLRELLNMAAGQIKKIVAPDRALGLPKIVPAEGLSADHRMAMAKGVTLCSDGPVKLFLWIFPPLVH